MKRNSIIVILVAIVFTFFFYKKDAGINLSLFSLLVVGIELVFKRVSFKNPLNLVVLSGTVVSAFLITINHTAGSAIMNVISLFLLGGIAAYPALKSLFHVIGMGFTGLVRSPIEYIKELNNKENGKVTPKKIVGLVKIVFFPILIIVLFYTIYNNSNFIFKEVVSGNVKSGFQFFSNYITGGIVFTFLAGLFVAIFLLKSMPNEKIVRLNKFVSEQINRKKSGKKDFQIHALRTEHKSAVFLLVVLNFLIFILNVIDIWFVWFSFEWQGENLKQFVHEGTYLLILSILISISIVLFYFRGNLNFYKKNRFLKILSYAWLAQNIILTISVAIRNFHYIDYFGLAFKRIGVILFLLMVIVGIISVIVKINKQKSSYFLFKFNTLSVYVLLLMFAFFNWNNIIAKYNFNHARESFLHIDFMATLTDSSLPYLIKSKEELETILEYQKEKFEQAKNTLTAEEYVKAISLRKDFFIKQWEQKGVLEWNLPEHKAYQQLINH